MNEVVAGLLKHGPDAENDPDEVAALAASARPGTAVVPLSMIDPAGLSRTGLTDAAAAWSRIEGWAAAQRYRILAEFHGPLPDDVCCALGLTSGEADEAHRTAKLLVQRLPAMLHALTVGELSHAQVRDAIVTLNDSVPADPVPGELVDLPGA